MAAAANSPTANHSPRLSGDNAQSRRAAAAVARTVSPPWTQIVRGADSEAIPAGPSSPSSASAAVVVQEQVVAASDCSPGKDSSPDDSATEGSDNGNGNAGKKPAWNKPSNGAAEVGPVMGAVSWPALSESTRASQKSSSDSMKPPSDGSVVVSQGTANALPSPKQVPNNANPNSTSNHTIPTRQKSMKRGVSNASANGGLTQAPALPGSVVEMPSNNPSNTHKSSNWETGQRGGGSGSQSHSGNDHPPQRNSFRRGSGGPHPRGDGSYNHNYGGRQDRTNHGWNPQRSFNNRDAHMQPQRVAPRGFIPHGSAPFFTPPPPPPPGRPFGTPIGFSEMPHPIYYFQAPHPESLRGVPFVTPIPPMYLPFTDPQLHAADPQLHAKLVSQIDYYFSNENLIKDIYLRQNMDDQGWVPIQLIASFKKVLLAIGGHGAHKVHTLDMDLSQRSGDEMVKQVTTLKPDHHVLLLTESIQLIMDAVRTSNVVEVQGDKVRKRNDWIRWIMPPSVQFPGPSGSQSLGRSSHDTLAAQVQNIVLEDKTNNPNSARGQADVHAEDFKSRSSAGDLNSQLQPSSGEGTGQVTVQAGSDRSVLPRSSSKRDSC